MLRLNEVMVMIGAKQVKQDLDVKNNAVISI